MINKLNIQPIILCGGSGSRLWPLSRQSFPKQFLNLIGESKRSLLQLTILRLKKLKNLENPILICNEEHRFIVAEQMRQINIKPKSIILEPCGRNTAPAVAIGSIRSSFDLDDSILLVLASDHSIKDEEEFINILEEGYEAANSDNLVTFGIIPTSPEVGFGYIESNEKFNLKKKFSPIVRFIEKPNLELAEKLFSKKNFFWNSGIFMFKTSKIIDEFNKLAPEILNACKSSLATAKKDLDFLRLDEKNFSKCSNISLDIAIMEKTNKGVVIKLDAGWSDLGNWKALWENDKKDSNGNVIQGRVLSENVKNCYLRSESRIIACLDIEDLIIVENSDSVLVANKSSAQSVKEIVKELDYKGFIEGKSHKKVYRPWGNYTSIAEDERWQVKMIVVKPDASLSLQMHHHRSEHWIIVKGTALVEINETSKFLSENESVYIPLGCKHRLANPGKLDLILIEVQSGSYLGEDDIFRFKDDYGR